MQRRTLLRALGAAAGGSAATFAGLAVATDDAGAQTALSLDVAGDSASLGVDGAVASVTLDLDVEWAYDLPAATSPETVVIEIAAGVDELTVVDSAESAQLFTEADGSESFEVGLLEAGALTAADIEPDGSGTADTNVTVEARLRVESSSGDVIARETTSDEATLTVTRDGVEASEYGSIGGSGTLTIATN